MEEGFAYMLGLPSAPIFVALRLGLDFAWRGGCVGGPARARFGAGDAIMALRSAVRVGGKATVSSDAHVFLV